MRDETSDALAAFARLIASLEGVLAAIQLGISNGRLEALNSRVRLISHRAHGFHSPQALIAMVYLCCAGVQIDLPHR